MLRISRYSLGLRAAEVPILNLYRGSSSLVAQAEDVEAVVKAAVQAAVEAAAVGGAVRGLGTVKHAGSA
jgi:hypothetical protein